jgi:phosphoribosyl-dephospho-CoA transferase
MKMTHHQRRPLPMLLLAAAMLAQSPALYAQHDELLVSTTPVADGPVTPTAGPAEVRNEAMTKRAAMELQAVDELLIVGSTDQGGLYQVEIMDEQGRVLRRESMELPQGHRLLPISVDGLLAGNYVASISGPHERQVLRFRCD